MLKLSIWELIFRTIPEGFLFILAAYAFGRKRIDRNRYILSSIILGIIVYVFRMLPIHFGVHTILIMMVHILLSAVINRIELKRAVSAALVSTILMFLSEGLNVLLIDKLLNVKIENIAGKVSTKLIYSSPSLILFAVVIFALYRIFNKTKRG